MPEKPDRVLLVDDSRSIVQFLGAQIRDLTHSVVDVATNLEEARALLVNGAERYFVTVLDLNLPDAPDGEIVDLARGENLPCIVLTGYIDDDLRDHILSKRVIDYVVKANASEINHVAEQVRRVQLNRGHRILVVDDSRSFRKYLSDLLAIHCFQTMEAADGVEALKRLEEHPDTSMVLTDYHMPKMDGQELVGEIRRSRGRNELAIIGISERASPLVSAKFLKTGANDFITKPFLVEEFYCRITQNIETIEHIRAIRDNATHDYLTRVYNRAYLFEAGAQFYENARRGNIRLAVAMVDIDFFKRVNDSYGHLVGDVALQHVASTIQKNVRKGDLVGRYGGEEFCLLIANAEDATLAATLERLREQVAAQQIPHADRSLSVTVSIGATQDLTTDFKAMISQADAALYRAKEQGRNRVLMAPARASVT